VRRTRHFIALVSVLGLCLLLGLSLGVAPASAGPVAAHRGSGDGTGGALTPGEPVVLRQRVPVNVVLVGYDARRVAPGLRAQLADGGAPVVRFPRYYGLEGRDLGLRYGYDYRIVDAPSDFEDGFFSYLTATGTESAPTPVQQAYNNQQRNVRDVTGPILNIDAPATERYLEDAAQRRLGLHTDRGYTVFLVNWWGRDDFRFHVYRTTAVDPDTGVDFGPKSSRAQIAWGGDSGRSWFYDLSAGPHAWTSNWNVDDWDLDGNGVKDYRMPPVWEYTWGGFRAPVALGPDLGKIVRYVAVNLLFTSSAYYDPLVSAPRPGGAKDVHVAMLEGDPAQDGTSLIDTEASLREWRALEPYHRWRVSLKDYDPIPADAAQALAIWTGRSEEDGCWQRYGSTLAQLFCWADTNREKYLPTSDLDHIIGVLSFNTTDADMGGALGALGLADDNWTDGTPSYVFTFNYPAVRRTGFGFTTTTTHEVGHYLGLSHPHDGFDPTTGKDYLAKDGFYFANAGDESATVMSYNALSASFSVFDRDNMSRWQLAGYLGWTSALLGDLQGVDLTEAEAQQLSDADVLAVRALRAFDGWRFVRGAGYARSAWELVQTVATAHGIEHDPAPARTFGKRAAGGQVVHPDPYPNRFPEE
jgi:hypothetical protein